MKSHAKSRSPVSPKRTPKSPLAGVVHSVPISKSDTLVIFGTHPVVNALKKVTRHISSIAVVVEKSDSIRVLVQKSGVKIPVHIVTDSQLDKMTKNAVHQGVVATLSSFPYTDVEAITGSRRVLVLDQIQDPQNVGALIRSAVAFGFSAVLLPEYDQAQITGVVAKSSAGTIFDLPIVRISNVSQILETLKSHQFWVVGLAGEKTSVDIQKFDFDAKIALVVGSEGDGLRELTRKTCDVLVKIPMPGNVESLNVSVAGAIAMWEANKKA